MRIHPSYFCLRDGGALHLASLTIWNVHAGFAGDY